MRSDSAKVPSFSHWAWSSRSSAGKLTFGSTLLNVTVGTVFFAISNPRTRAPSRLGLGRALNGPAVPPRFPRRKPRTLLGLRLGSDLGHRSRPPRSQLVQGSLSTEKAGLPVSVNADRTMNSSEARPEAHGERFGDPGGPDAGEATSSAASASSRCVSEQRRS